MKVGNIEGETVGFEVGVTEGLLLGKNDGCAVGAQSYGVDEHINVTL